MTPRITYDEVLIEETQVAKPDVSVLRVSEKPVRAGGAATAMLRYAVAPASG